MNESLPPDPEDWFQGATELAGSWWPDWHRWITGQPGGATRCRRGSPATASCKAIEDAPGSYVKVMATD